MVVPEREPESWQVLEFLTRFAADREAGGERSLRDYLADFPGDEEAIAVEYLALTRGVDRAPSLDIAQGAVEAGRMIGAFRVCHEIGRGGQGVVYLAEDTRTGAEVALKVLAFPMRGRHTSARFLREATIAGRLDHPGICRVLESGVDGDLQFIAMPFISGQPLEQLLSAAGKGLPWEKVVTWMEVIARALQAAHGAGVVHRDIKPGNLMIDAEGRPVVLDLGLARDLGSESTLLTVTGDLFGTPAYMSPEQLEPRGDRTGPATDVWSLAVVLYECLTGHRPFEAAVREGVFDAIRHRDPTSPKRFVADLPAGLVAVLGVALAKEPERRYQSAGHFADDLERVRLHRPVHAKAPGLGLRVRRFARRNPALTVSVGLLFVVLSAALIHTHNQREREAGLRATADQRSQELRRLVRHILFDLHGAVQDMPGATLANKEIVERALEFLQLLGPVSEGVVPPDIAVDLALAHIKIGDVLGNRQYSNLGRPEDAAHHYRQALRLVEELGDRGGVELRARCQLRMGNSLEFSDGVRAARASYARGLRLLAAEPGSGAARVLLAGQLHLQHARCIARLESRPDRMAAAAAELEASLGSMERWKNQVEIDLCRAETLQELARFQRSERDERKLVDFATRSQELLLALPTKDLARVRTRLLLAASHSLLADVADRESRLDEAIDHRKDAVATLDILVRLDPANELARRRLIGVRRQLGSAWSVREQFASARSELQRALDLVDDSERRFGRGWAETQRGHLLLHLGEIAYEARDFPGALTSFERALGFWSEHYRADPADTGRRQLLASSELLVARAQGKFLPPAKSRAGLLRSRRHFRALAEQEPGNVSHVRALQNIGQLLAEQAFAVGDFETAAERFQEAVDLRRAAQGNVDQPIANRSLAILLQGLASATYQCSRFPAAVAAMQESVALFRRNTARLPGDAVCGRQLAFALTELARMQRKVDGLEVALENIREASELAGRFAKPGSASPKAIQTHVYALVVAAYLWLEKGDPERAGGVLAEAESTRARIPKVPMMTLYSRILAAVRSRLGKGG